MVGLQGRRFLPPAPLQIPSSPHPNEALPTLGPPTIHSCLASGWLGLTSSAPSDDLGGGFPRRRPVGCGCLLAPYRRIDKRNALLPPVSGPCTPKLLLQSCPDYAGRKIPGFTLADQLPSDRLHLHPAGVHPGYTARCSTTRGVSHVSHVACSSRNTACPATATWPSVQTSLIVFEHIRGLAVRLQHV